MEIGPLNVWRCLGADRLICEGEVASIGSVHTTDFEYSLNPSRFHGSANAFDAMDLSRGGRTLLYYFNLGGIVVQEEWRINEAHSTECTVIAGGDVSHLARKFAKRCALDVVHLWHAPKVVINYLKSDSEGLLPLARKAVREAEIKANKIGDTGDRSAIYRYALRSALEATTPIKEASAGLHYTYGAAIWASRTSEIWERRAAIASKGETWPGICTVLNYEHQKAKLEQYRQTFEAMAMERFGLK